MCHVSFATRKGKQKRNEYFDSAAEADVLQAVTEQVSHSPATAPLSRPLRRVRRSLRLQDNFPQQTRSIIPTECDSFVVGTAQHCPKHSFEVDGTARLVFKTNSSISEPSHGSLLNYSKWLVNKKSRLLKHYIAVSSYNGDISGPFLARSVRKLHHMGDTHVPYR